MPIEMVKEMKHIEYGKDTYIMRVEQNPRPKPPRPKMPGRTTFKTKKVKK